MNNVSCEIWQPYFSSLKKTIVFEASVMFPLNAYQREVEQTSTLRECSVRVLFWRAVCLAIDRHVRRLAGLYGRTAAVWRDGTLPVPVTMVNPPRSLSTLRPPADVPCSAGASGSLTVSCSAGFSRPGGHVWRWPAYPADFGENILPVRGSANIRRSAWGRAAVVTLPPKFADIFG